MSTSDLDKSELATPYKLAKARERGQVAKSVETVSCSVLLAGTAYCLAQGWDFLLALVRILRSLLGDVLLAGAELGSVLDLFKGAVLDCVRHLLAFFGSLVLAGIFANIAQVGVLLSVESLKPDWTRLSPATGIKRLFSKRTLVDGARAAIKVVLLATVGWFAIESLLPQFAALTQLPPAALARVIHSDFGSVCLRLTVALAVVAVVDIIYTKRAFQVQMRMSRREVRDELKGREGDPQVRGRMRQLRAEMRRRIQSLRRAGDADLLITNPTHIAIALRYERSQMLAPQVLAKGQGPSAVFMRALAASRGVPVVRQPELARDIYTHVDIDGFVPERLYARVARLVVWAAAMREIAKRRSVMSHP